MICSSDCFTNLVIIIVFLLLFSVIFFGLFDKIYGYFGIFFVFFDFQTNIHFEVNKTSTKFGEKIQDSRKRYSWNHLLNRSIIDLSVPIERVLKSMVQRVFGIFGCILKKYSKSKQTKYSGFVELGVRWPERDINWFLCLHVERILERQYNVFLVLQLHFPRLAERRPPR